MIGPELRPREYYSKPLALNNSTMWPLLPPHLRGENVNGERRKEGKQMSERKDRKKICMKLMQTYVLSISIIRILNNNLTITWQ